MISPCLMALKSHSRSTTRACARSTSTPRRVQLARSGTPNRCPPAPHCPAGEDDRCTADDGLRSTTAERRGCRLGERKPRRSAGRGPCLVARHRGARFGWPRPWLVHQRPSGEVAMHDDRGPGCREWSSSAARTRIAPDRVRLGAADGIDRDCVAMLDALTLLHRHRARERTVLAFMAQGRSNSALSATCTLSSPRPPSVCRGPASVTRAG